MAFILLFFHTHPDERQRVVLLKYLILQKQLSSSSNFLKISEIISKSFCNIKIEEFLAFEKVAQSAKFRALWSHW